ncbi:phosphatase PAP2 family protein [Vogesella sp. DC21W]|uniref:Phosphatase PAP2 family protein n=1 Tax=Vogesella aquatica TaxID=2984206 RepID=A0ABT5IYZ6_9NEIS|nr:phosphatase PAP2 family protein [Vogesella aquatica]MDC7717378.1 phosphatase PAP2 family protein [Vogesella aquatica]
MALVFGVLALLVWLTGVNQALFITLHHALAVLPGAVWRLLSMAGEWTLVIGVLLLLAARQPALLPRMLVLGSAGVLASIALKAGFDVLRPPLVLPAGTVNLLDVLPGNHSFPSGHAIAVAVLAGALMPRRSLPTQLGLALLAALVCLSRLAIGVHWPLDVLAGAACGFTLAHVAGRVGKSAAPTALLLPAVKALVLVLLAVTVWKLGQGRPNEAYVLYNLITLAIGVVALRGKVAAR